jgi:phosphocarrier protein
MIKTFKVTDPSGMHARPASLFVKVAGSLTDDVTMMYDGKSVNAKSIMGVMSLGIPTEVEFSLESSEESLEVLETELKGMGLI